jgi:hypothetical protein
LKGNFGPSGSKPSTSFKKDIFKSPFSAPPCSSIDLKDEKEMQLNMIVFLAILDAFAPCSEYNPEQVFVIGPGDREITAWMHRSPVIPQPPAYVDVILWPQTPPPAYSPSSLTVTIQLDGFVRVPEHLWRTSPDGS